MSKKTRHNLRIYIYIWSIVALQCCIHFCYAEKWLRLLIITLTALGYLEKGTSRETAQHHVHAKVLLRWLWGEVFQGRSEESCARVQVWFEQLVVMTTSNEGTGNMALQDTHDIPDPWGDPPSYLTPLSRQDHQINLHTCSYVWKKRWTWTPDSSLSILLSHVRPVTFSCVCTSCELPQL